VRLQITAVANGDAATRRDVLLGVSGATPVRELAAHLAGPDGPSAPGCYLGTDLLDPETPLADSGILDGAVVGLGAPVPPPERYFGPERAGMPQHPDDAPRVEVQLVGGPDAGRVHTFGPGTHLIGAGPAAAVPLTGRDLPDEGLLLTVRPDGTALVRLPADERAWMSLPEPPPDRAPAHALPLPGPDQEDQEEPVPASLPDGRQHWPPGTDIAYGEHLLRLSEPTGRDAAVTPSEGGGGLDYNRPPRILPHLQPERFRLPGPPGAPGRMPIPLLATLSPLVMGVAMAYFFRSPFYLVFTVLSPVMMAANTVSGRRGARKNYLEQVRQYRVRRSSLEADVERKLDDEQRQRAEAGLDPAAAGLSAVGPGRRLWERRRSDPDHLMLRIGTADQPSLLEVEDGAREDNHQSVRWTIPDAPVAVDLARCGVVGLAGEAEPVRALARWATAQAAVLHSPRDLRIVVLTDRAGADSWDWVRWLPHSRAEGADVVSAAPVLLGNDPETVANRVSELVSALRAREQAAEASMSRALRGEPDLLVVLDGARRLRDVPGVVQILKQGPELRVFSLCLDAEERLLPEECTSVVRYADRRLTLSTTGLPDVEDIRPDLVEPAWCERVARGMAPIRDVTPDASAGLPAHVGLLDLLGLPEPAGAALAARWQRERASTTALMGVGYDGPVAFDLVRDGPHGLVAGTTGSGKSELLQTFVASLAAANRPDEMTFVLVDYKGGSAFKECVDLPHTLGMVTDLDSHLVQRALRSLSAELVRRETLLAAAGAKDLPEYQAMRRRDPHLVALPRLVLVIDEFATLVKEVEEFVPGLVSIAQRGRSLGLHLVLATQRPAGAVSADIRANTNLRICLRVTDAPDSQDVIDTRDAVSISPATPGRALARLGQGMVTPFQAAYAGTPRPGASPVPEETGPRVWSAALPWQRLGRAVEAPATERAAAPEAAEEPPTDLRVLVAAAREAAELAGCAPQPRPWLPALGEEVLLDDLLALTHPAGTEGTESPGGPAPKGSGARPTPVPWALADLPAAQQQIPLRLDLAEFGHFYVVGAPRSGRSQVLRTMAGALARTLGPADVHLYGIDFGGGSLAAVGVLPHCGAVVPRGDAERVGRLLTRLDRELATRQELLTERHAGDLTELRESLAAARRPPHIVLLIDGWDAMADALEGRENGRYLEMVNRLLREGAAAGVHVVATSERALLHPRMQTLNDDQLLLRMNDPGEYYVLGMKARDVPADIVPGRGWRSGGIELQVALLAPGTTGQEQAEALRRIGAEASKRSAGLAAERRPFRIDSLPARIGFTEAYEKVPAEARRPMRGLLGIGGDDLAPVYADFAQSAPAFMVSGPPGSGRSTALASLAVTLLAGGTRLVVLAPRESPLRLLGPHPGVELLTSVDPSAEEFATALRTVTGPGVVLVDDADILGYMPSANLELRTVVNSGRDRGLGLACAATPETLTGAAVGWIGEARRHRKGLLLQPQSLLEGDLLGVRLTQSQLFGRVPGRGLLPEPRTGALITVQVPEIVQGPGGLA
jgi:S-DNA-T family DNA segregation ATPase FtsK/SpoIIIE